MAIKINGATVITNSRRGVFKSVNPGSYATSSRPSGASEGDVIYDSDEKNIYVYNGTEWIGTGGGEVNNLNPAIPPFVSKTGPATNLSNSDGKVEFSLDGNSFSSSLSIPTETIYYCDWTNDILSAAHDSTYETAISVDYPNLGTSQNIELKLKIDKLPDAFAFTPVTDGVGNSLYTSNTISPLQSINAPTAIWGSSNAVNPQIAIADGPWEALPTTINTRYVNMNERIRVRHTSGTTASTDYSTTINIGYGTGTGEYETANFSTTTASFYQVMRVVVDIKGGAGRSNPSNGGSCGGGEGGEGQFMLEYNSGTPNGASDLPGSFTYVVGQSNNNTTGVKANGHGKGGLPDGGWNGQAGGGGGSAIFLDGNIIAVCGGGGGGGDGYVNQNYGLGAGGAGLNPNQANVDGNGGTSSAANNTNDTGQGGSGGLGAGDGENYVQGVTQGGKRSGGGAGGGGGGGGKAGGCATSGNGAGNASDQGHGGGGGGGGIVGLEGTVVGSYTIKNISGDQGRGGSQNSSQDPGYIKLQLQTKQSNEPDTAWVDVGAQWVRGAPDDNYYTGSKALSDIANP